MFLAAGAGPDARGEDGLPVLRVALAASDLPGAEVLVAAGAGPHRRLPDGSTPLLRGPSVTAASPGPTR